MGWFAYEPEWYEANNKSFAQSEAHSVSLFVHHLVNERVDIVSTDLSSKGRGFEAESNTMVGRFKTNLSLQVKLYLECSTNVFQLIDFCAD